MLKTDHTITGAGGIFSTADDLARFVIANLNEGRVADHQALPAEAVRRAHTAQVKLEQRFYEFDRHAYGLGFYRAEYDGDLLVHHFGGFPGYRSHLSFMPEHRIGVVVLQNEGIDGNPFADLVATYIYDLLNRPDVETRARRRIEELRAGILDAREARAGWESRLAHLKERPVDPAFPLSAYAGTYARSVGQTPHPPSGQWPSGGLRRSDRRGHSHGRTRVPGRLDPRKRTGRLLL